MSLASSVAYEQICWGFFCRRCALACRPLAELELQNRMWVSTILLLVWVKSMDPLQSVFEDFFLLVKMIALMIGKTQSGS